MSNIYDGDAADIKKYIKLCQFYHMVQKSNRCAEDVNALIAIMCKKGFDINYSIPMNSYMYQKQPELLGCTALHFAAMEQNVQMTTALLKWGADFTMRNHNGFTALRMAVQTRYEPFEKLYKKISQEYDLARAILDYHVHTSNTTNPACNGGITHFYLACIVNHVQAIEFFLDNGVSMTDVVSFPELLGFTALHFAAMFCSYDAVQALLSRGADASVADAKGWTPLHWLMKRRLEIREDLDDFLIPLRENEAAIILMLEKSIADDIMNAIDGIGLSYFHVACTLTVQPKPIIEKILEHVEDVNAAVNLNSPICPGYTPLHFAAAFSISNVKLLISRGANIAAKDVKGITPFDICLKHWGNRVVHWMLSQNESLAQVSFSKGSKLLDFLLAVDKYYSLKTFLDFDLDINDYIALDSPLWPGYTPMHLAVVFATQGILNLEDWRYEEYPDLGNSPVISVCLEYNANCKARDANNLTPLHLAFKLRNKKLVAKLLKHQSFKGERFLSVSELEGVSYLHIACAIRESTDVKRLLHSGADVNETTKADFVWYNSANEATLVRAGSTPLHILLSLGGFDMVTTLLSLGADPTIRNARGLTSIHFAHVLRAPSLVVDQLLSNHTFGKTNAVARGGLSHLHVACADGAPCTVEEYLQLDGVDVNAPITNENDMDDRSESDDENENLELRAYQQYLQTHTGYTPLHFAVNRQDNNPHVIKLLLRHGADVTARTAAAKLSPLHRSSQKQDANGIIVEESERCMLVLEHLYAQLKEQHGNGFVDDAGWTLLHVACQLRHVDEVERLLEAGAEVNARLHADSPIWPRDTPLHMVVRGFSQSSEVEEQKKKIIRTLLEHGADVDAVNSKGTTPLHLAQLVDVDRLLSGKGEITVIFINLTSLQP